MFRQIAIGVVGAALFVSAAQASTATALRMPEFAATRRAPLFQLLQHQNRSTFERDAERGFEIDRLGNERRIRRIDHATPTAPGSSARSDR